MADNRGLSQCYTRVVTALFAIVYAAPAVAHDIPNDVTIQAFLKPEGHRLLFLARVPLTALRETALPVRDTQNYLDLARAKPLLPDAALLTIADSLDVYEDQTLLAKPRLLATQISLPSDKSFVSWPQALAHIEAPPLPDETTLLANQTMLDALFEYPIRSDQARFAIDPAGLAYLGLRTVTILRFQPPQGSFRAFEFEGSPGLIHLDPRWYQAASRFVRMGFFHILDGTDHLLFLFCLVVPFRRLRALIPVITSFTVAHSITLIASAYHYAPDFPWFPPLIELLIAVSIFFMAIENIVGVNKNGGSAGDRRWIIAFAFGLVHGFGFSFALRQTLQFAGSYLLASLLSFNIGVELGQLLVLALLISALNLLFRYFGTERLGVTLLSAIAADIGGHWLVERWENLRKLRIAPPELTPALTLNLLRWAAFLVVALGVWRLAADRWRKRRTSATATTQDPNGSDACALWRSASDRAAETGGLEG